jgi:hypothetical protein
MQRAARSLNFPIAFRQRHTCALSRLGAKPLATRIEDVCKATTCLFPVI